MFCLLGLATTSLPAAPARRIYDLPEGDAAVTLRLFVEQSGEQVIYLVNRVKGQRTNPVQGQLTAREALERMVAESELTVVQDEKTGALTVSRLASSREPEPTSPNTPKKKMKTSRPLTRLGGLLALLLAGAADPLAAQTDPATPSEKPDKDVVVLSPFQVNTSRDVGFVAASSLAGGRLAGDLSDTAAAYSVITREFLDALDISDLKEASQWTVNTSSNDDDASNALLGAFLPSTFNARGTNSNGQYRNFFPGNFNPDSYNVDRFDYARGPNAILFGPGGISGTANIVTKQALLGKKQDELRFQLGSWSKYRATVDSNIPLGERAAVRVNGLWQDSKGWRENVFDNRKGLHLAGTWRATDRLTLKGEAEWGKFDRAVAFTTFLDQMSGWDGVTVFATPVTSIATNVANASSAARLAAPTFVIAPALGGDTVLNLGNNVRTRGGNTSQAIAVGGVRVASPVSANIANQVMLYSLNSPDWEQRMGPILNSPLVPQVTKDFLRNLNSPDSEFTQSFDGPNNVINFRTFTASAEYQATERLFFELAANNIWQWSTSELLARSSMTAMQLDLTQTLADGSANAGFLQPYSQFYRQVARIKQDSDNVRAAAAYILPATRIGDFKFNLSAGYQETTSTTDRPEYALKGITDDPRTWGAPATINGVSVDPRIYYRYYWTINTPGNRPVAETTAPVSMVLNGRTYTGTPGWVQDMSQLTALTQSIVKDTYYQAAMNWSFWKRRVNVLGSVRHDIYSGRNRTPPPALTDAVYGPGWDGLSVPYRPAAPENYNSLSDADKAKYSPPDVEVDQTTYAIGVVFHATKWLSPFVDYSTSFNPNGVATDIDGNSFAPRVSKGWDAGVKLNLFGGRVLANLSRYGGKEDNQQINVGGAAGLAFALDGMFNNIISARPIGGGAPGNIRGVAQVPRGYNDRRDLTAEGYEIEVVANLAPGWRLSGNLALPEASQENAYADSRRYLAANRAVLRQIATDAGVVIDASGNASVGPDFSPEAPNAATAWNNLNAFEAAVIADAQKVNRLPKVTANLFTDYRFGAGPLKGFLIGIGGNYRGKEIIGNRGADLIANPANPTTSIDDPSVGPFDYIYAKETFVMTAKLGYLLRLAKNRTLSFDFRVDNLLDDEDPRYYDTIQRPPGGDLSSYARVSTPHRYYLPTPRNYLFTTTLRF